MAAGGLGQSTRLDEGKCTKEKPASFYVSVHEGLLLLEGRLGQAFQIWAAQAVELGPLGRKGTVQHNVEAGWPDRDHRSLDG